MSSSISEVLNQRLEGLIGKLPSTTNDASSQPFVLVLLAGGSLVENYVEILAELEILAEKHGMQIGISLTDERIADNNTWQELAKLAQELPPSSRLQFVRPASPELANVWHAAQLKVGLFGAGNDLHTAGILPFEQELFKRIFPENVDFTSYDVPKSHPNQTSPKRWTISPSGISKLDLAILVLGQGKEAVANFVENSFHLSGENTAHRQHEFPLLALKTAKNFELVQIN